MPIKTDLRPLERKGRTIPADVRPPCRLLASNEFPSATKQIQHQHLTARYGIAPAFAVIIAALLYRDAE